MAKKVILDVDTGSDDAIAICAAILSPDLDVEGICTVWGNLEVPLTTANTLRVLHALGSNVPVYKGCPNAMVKYLAGDRIDAPPPNIIIDGKEFRMHTKKLDLPDSPRKEESKNAVAYYIETLRAAAQPITIIPVGPLTNLGVALSIAPDIISGIEEIVIMGGADRQGNVTLCAEANVWHDPEAAQIILNSGAKVRFVPLDATHAACLTADDCKKLRALGTFAGSFSASLLEQRILIHTHSQPLDIPDAAAVHDALAVCAVIDPSVLEDVQEVNVSIGLRDFGEGRTVIDRRLNPETPNCKFAFNGNRLRFAQLLLDIFSRTA